ncbi:hypothetical protein VAR608DRAFT_4930 [Variovorax sp. HW608]|uniref:hypothetical protein n=1 Tax=Variovorax sp. HW608 TaxID=1034889 RepID=UPI00081FCC79|nr:hypothetical protein [Variovorax sp. HW608]SCK49492.1 hypothetical protein VAR608DRAFT_4930 [Variovorax sp. HW608]
MPNYWMYETSGVLRPAVEAYLRDEPMTPEHIAALRAYLRQWIAYPWAGSEAVHVLRKAVDQLYSREAIDDWLELAIEQCIDPL